MRRAADSMTSRSVINKDIPGVEGFTSIKHPSPSHNPAKYLMSPELIIVGLNMPRSPARATRDRACAAPWPRDGRGEECSFVEHPHRITGEAEIASHGIPMEQCLRGQCPTVSTRPTTHAADQGSRSSRWG